MCDTCVDQFARLHERLVTSMLQRYASLRSGASGLRSSGMLARKSVAHAQRIRPLLEELAHFELCCLAGAHAHRRTRLTGFLGVGALRRCGLGKRARRAPRRRALLATSTSAGRPLGLRASASKTRRARAGRALLPPGLHSHLVVTGTAPERRAGRPRCRSSITTTRRARRSRWRHDASSTGALTKGC